ncbi:hypothetical protein QQP08_019005 [Theobroma cacao]|uniref:Uncharacterized protein LOC18597034 n=1 Tax=Theobroma cacao TaxID=3641 RepID=A0AB32V1U6_THECC|nr:PREDICTED: uncharacterized protein LOC18597034 [Theobroma cacao]WRX26518.1 hypothetical protein QQP08_019005 [Theobroma cacao]
MPAAWFSLKRPGKSKAELSDTQDSKGRSSKARKPCLCSYGCSMSISNLRDVIHGSKRHTDKAPIGSPRSIGSSDILNPITHQVVFTDSKCELKITRCSNNGAGNGGSTFVGTLRPGTPGPGDRFLEPAYICRRSFSLSRTILGGPPIFGSSNDICSKPRRSLDAGSQGFVCHKCGENFRKLEAIEAHHLSRHAVTALSDGDSSKKIVELICQTSLLGSETEFGPIERILKVHNMQRSLAQFEDYREMVKIKANKLSKKHPRCLADGNELLRFYGTTVACSIGMKNTSSPCTLKKCGICQILRHGFSTMEKSNGFRGVFTSSIGKRALECIELDEENRCLRKALVVCRVIAGRVQNPLENAQEMASQSSFDSLAGNFDSHSNIEELYSLNPRALFPCFVVICKPSKQSAQKL